MKEYRVMELAKELGVGRTTAYRLLQSGTIKAYKRWGNGKKGDVWVVPQKSIDEYRNRYVGQRAKPIVCWYNQSDAEYLSFICSNCKLIVGMKRFINNERMNKKAEEKALHAEISPICPHCKSILKKQ